MQNVFVFILCMRKINYLSPKNKKNNIIIFERVKNPNFVLKENYVFLYYLFHFFVLEIINNIVYKILKIKRKYENNYFMCEIIKKKCIVFFIIYKLS